MRNIFLVILILSIVSCTREEPNKSPQTTIPPAVVQVNKPEPYEFNIFEEFPEEANAPQEKVIEKKEEKPHHKSSERKKDNPTVLLTTIVSLLGTVIALGKKYLDKVE